MTAVDLVAFMHLLYVDIGATKTDRKLNIHQCDRASSPLHVRRGRSGRGEYAVGKQLNSLSSHRTTSTPQLEIRTSKYGSWSLFWRHFHLYSSWMPPKGPWSARCMACQSGHGCFRNFLSIKKNETTLAAKEDPVLCHWLIGIDK